LGIFTVVKILQGTLLTVLVLWTGRQSFNFVSMPTLQDSFISK